MANQDLRSQEHGLGTTPGLGHGGWRKPVGVAREPGLGVSAYPALAAPARPQNFPIGWLPVHDARKAYGLAKASVGF